jgi:hypothetical protein
MGAHSSRSPQTGSRIGYVNLKDAMGNMKVLVTAQSITRGTRNTETPNLVVMGDINSEVMSTSKCLTIQTSIRATTFQNMFM